MEKFNAPLDYISIFFFFFFFIQKMIIYEYVEIIFDTSGLYLRWKNT